MTQAIAEINQCKDIEDLSRKAAAFVAMLSRQAVRDRHVFTIALPGGNTPKQMYQILRQHPLVDEVPWSNFHVYFGDERWVPTHHPENNYQMARETLLDHVGIPLGQIYPVPTDLPGPQEGAVLYEETIRRAFAVLDFGVGGQSAEEREVLAENYDFGTSGVPRLDLVLLGLGADGHVASLFPATDALNEKDRLVIGTTRPGIGRTTEQARVSMTIPLLSQARTVAFLVSGADKADALWGALESEESAEMHPAKSIIAGAEDVKWFVDEAAASRLSFLDKSA